MNSNFLCLLDLINFQHSKRNFATAFLTEVSAELRTAKLTSEKFDFAIVETFESLFIYFAAE